MGLAASLALLAGPQSRAHAAEPHADAGAVEGPAARSHDDAGPLSLGAFELALPLALSGPPRTVGAPELAALPPAPARLLVPPIYAKRKRDRTFDTSHGEVDPRKRSLPRTHRFRLALHAQWVRLTRTENPNTQELERFHFAPMMIDLGYQAQFLKYVMVRLAIAAGGNVANTRNAMAAVIFPQAYVGAQTKVFGIAFGYGYDLTLPATVGATANYSNALEQPVITRNHVVMGELSLTSRVDRVALTFSLAIGGMKSRLVHYGTNSHKFRPYFGFQFGAFFDGTIRRERKARKKAEAKK